MILHVSMILQLLSETVIKSSLVWAAKMIFQQPEVTLAIFSTNWFAVDWSN